MASRLKDSLDEAAVSAAERRQRLDDLVVQNPDLFGPLLRDLMSFAKPESASQPDDPSGPSEPPQGLFAQLTEESMREEGIELSPEARELLSL